MKNILYTIIIAILLIPIVNAIYITSPTYDQNLTRNINITFEEYNQLYNHRILLNDSTILVNGTLTDTIINDTYWTGYYSGQVYIGLNTTIGGLINYSIIYCSGVQGGNTVTLTLDYTYSDGSTLQQSVIGSGSLINTYQYKNVTRIVMSSIQTMNGDTIACYGSVYGLRNTNSYNIDLLKLTKNIGAYNISIIPYNSTINLTGNNSRTFNIISNAVLNLTVISYLGTLLNYSANLSNNIINSSGNITFDVIKYSNYSLRIIPTNANPYVELTFNITSSGVTNKLVETTANNSINITIYDAVTLTKILQPLNIVVTSGIANNYSTSTGNILITNIQSGLNEIKIYNINYTESRYSITILDGTTQWLSAYLAPVSSSQNVTFTFYDYTGATITGIYAQSYLLTNQSYVQISSAYSDISGKVYFSYNPLYSYTYNYSGTGYKSSTFILNPPRESNYDITVAPSSLETIYNLANVTGIVSYNNITHIISFNYISSDTSLTTYSYTLSKIINSRPTIINYNGSISDSGTFYYNTIGYTGLVYIQGVADGRIFYGSYIDLGGQDSLGKTLGQKDSAFISGIIAMIIIFASITFGIFGIMVGGIVSLIIIYWLNLLTIVSLSFIVVSMIATIIIVMGIRRT